MYLSKQDLIRITTGVIQNSRLLQRCLNLLNQIFSLSYRRYIDFIMAIHFDSKELINFFILDCY